MRLFEIFLLFLDALLILMVVKRLRSRSATWMVGFLTILVVVIHIVYEGPRWQMAIAYFLTGSMVVLTIIRGQSPGARRPLWRLMPYSIALVLIYAIAVVLPVLVPVPKLPLPTGPYAVGTKSFHILDSHRQEIYGDNPGGPRELMLQLWYPAAPGQAMQEAPYLEDLEVAASVISERLGLPGFFLGHISLVDSHANTDARFNKTNAPFPLILFSHGLRGLRVQNTAMFLELASHGYVIASVDHTYDSIITIMPDGRAFTFDGESVFSESDSPEVAARRLLDVRVQDLESVLSFLHGKSSEPADLFYNGFQFNNLGIIGHSTGGGTAIQFCAGSEDCQAVAALDSWLEPVRVEIMEQSLIQPSMMINAPEWLSPENKAMGEDFFSRQAPPSYNIAIDGANHYNFTDIPLLSPIAHQLGLTGKIDGARSVRIVNGLALNFFDQYLGNSSDLTVAGYSSNFSEVTLDTN